MAKHVHYEVVSNGGKTSPMDYGYHIIPLYSIQHSQEMSDWVDENVKGEWTFFIFGPISLSASSGGTSYCFKDEIDAFAFKLRWI